MHRDRIPERAPGKQSGTESHVVQRLEPGKRTLAESLVAQPDAAAGGALPDGSRTAISILASVPASSNGPRPTLQMLFGVQRAASAAVDDPAQVHAAATRGTATPATQLPFVDQIQSAFGRHDVSGVQAHVGSDAAASARDMGARAYATGDHVVLGESTDLHTVAHEAAHVVQQRGGVQLKGGVGEVGDPYERHADEVADRVVRGESAEGVLDSMAPSAPAPPAAQAGPVQRDQRDTTRLPTADDQLALRGHLDPSTRIVHGGVAHVPLVRPAWDGNSRQPSYDAARNALFDEVGAGIVDFMRVNNTAVARAKGAPRVPLGNADDGGGTGLVGIANQAQAAIVADFGAWITGGVRGPGQQPSSSVALVGNTNVFDGSDRGTRQVLLGQNDEHYAFEVIKWTALNHPPCRDALAAHHWDSSTDPEAWPFLQNDVLLPYLRFGGNQAWFTDYHTYMVNEEMPGKVFFTTVTRPEDHGGDNDKADRAKRWELYAKSVHELMHGCAHPRFLAAMQHRVVMSEGFTEYFANQAIAPRMAAAAAGQDEALRNAVEGGAFTLDAALIPPYVIPAAYAAHVNEVTAIVARMGEKGVRAAFFQGHVEFLGLAPDGTEGPDLAPSHGAQTLRVPAGVTTFAELAIATGVGEGDLRAANLGATEPLGGSLVMPGCREHIVVSSPGTPDTAESRKQIAAQHGVDQNALIRANPARGNGAWVLAANDRVLVPHH
jgi:hypothetical protein